MASTCLSFPATRRLPCSGLAHSSIGRCALRSPGRHASALAPTLRHGPPSTGPTSKRPRRVAPAADRYPRADADFVSGQREVTSKCSVAEDRVLENFVDLAGRLNSIPVQRKKRLVVLRWLVEDFQPGRLYSEAEVNRVIARRHPDFASLRRFLVDEELMQRRRGLYWRTGSVPNVGHDPPSWPDL